jgi:hypothetical protein
MRIPILSKRRRKRRARLDLEAEDFLRLFDAALDGLIIWSLFEDL